MIIKRKKQKSTVKERWQSLFQLGEVLAEVKQLCPQRLSDDETSEGAAWRKLMDAPRVWLGGSATDEECRQHANLILGLERAEQAIAISQSGMKSDFIKLPGQGVTDDFSHEYIKHALERAIVWRDALTDPQWKRFTTLDGVTTYLN